MYVQTKVEFHPCKIDSKYTIGRVIKTYTTNWFDRLLGSKDRTVTLEYRTRSGIWYTFPGFIKFRPMSWQDEWVAYQLLANSWDEHREREAYIQATERM